jgi:hypothetical protein
MSKGRQNATKLVVLALILFALIAAVPASAHDRACPNGWRQIAVTQSDQGDDNADGQICVKTVGGNGNTNESSNTKDNHASR